MFNIEACACALRTFAAGIFFCFFFARVESTRSTLIKDRETESQRQQEQKNILKLNLIYQRKNALPRIDLIVSSIVGPWVGYLVLK